jgi:uncharacterized protein YukE
MSRPAGEPGALAAGSRTMAAAAGALGDVRRRLQGATSFVADAGAWRGPASEAFLVDGAGFQPGLGRAADAVGQLAGTLAELAARLEHAQATWDRARRLAATAGVDLDPAAPVPSAPVRTAPVPAALDPAGPGGPRARGPHWSLDGDVRSPVTAVDPAGALVAAEALRRAEAAELEAAAARRTAAARLERVGQPPAASAVRPPAGARAAESGRGHRGHRGHPGEGLAERVVDGVLEVGAAVAMATHHLVRAAEVRIEAAGRLAATADDPAVSMAARRVVETAGRPLVDGTVLGALPLAAPMLELTAAMHQGEPLPRALAGALGSAVGADLGGRAGLAACGGEAAVTEGVGLIVLPHPHRRRRRPGRPGRPRRRPPRLRRDRRARPAAGGQVAAGTGRVRRWGWV